MKYFHFNLAGYFSSIMKFQQKSKFIKQNIFNPFLGVYLARIQLKTINLIKMP